MNERGHDKSQTTMSALPADSPHRFRKEKKHDNFDGSVTWQDYFEQMSAWNGWSYAEISQQLSSL